VTQFAGATPGEWLLVVLFVAFFLGVVGVRKTPETAFPRYDNEKQNSTSVNSEFNIRRDRFRCGTKCYALP
jgi:hypothetical protein